MNLNFDKDLTEATARLAVAAPREWDAFKAAFKVFSDVRRDQLVMASLDEMPRAQGRAQLSATLIGVFDDAVRASQDAYDKRRNASR